MRSKIALVLFMLLAVAALLFIVSCPEETTIPREPEDELTIKKLTVVDNGDGVTLVTLPTVGQTLKARIELSNGSTTITQPVTYKWFHKDDSGTTLGSNATYTVTPASVGKVLSLTATVEGVGAATWEATSPMVIVALVEVVNIRDDLVTIPKVDYTIRANIKLSDDTYIYTEDEDNRVTYEWYHTDADQVVLSALGAYEVTGADVDETLAVRVSVTGLGSATWEADSKVLTPVLYNGEVEGLMGFDPGAVQISLHEAFDLLITGPPDEPDENGFAIFSGIVTGDIEGDIDARINGMTGIDTVYATITNTDATDDVRFIAYMLGGILYGEVITGLPRIPATEIEVKDSQGNDELNLSVAKGEKLQLVATTAPEGATNRFLWSVDGGGLNTIDLTDGLFDAKEAGVFTVIVKAYDDSNLTAKEVTITVTE